MNEFDRFEALSFDCYGTLIDWESGLGAELEPWARRHGIEADREALLTAVGRAESAVQRGQPDLPYPDVLAGMLDRLADEYGVVNDDGERIAFGQSVARWPAFPDSADALARLHTRFRLIILSNIDRASFAASNERLGIDFDLVITAEDVGAYKPDGRNFAALLDALPSLGVTSAALLHVAQSLYHDHEPAQALGLATAWIDRRHDKAGYGATPPPQAAITPDWRFPSMAAFADAALE